jgi:hypothetical protein
VGLGAKRVRTTVTGLPVAPLSRVNVSVNVVLLIHVGILVARRCLGVEREIEFGESSSRDGTTPYAYFRYFRADLCVLFDVKRTGNLRRLMRNH